MNTLFQNIIQEVDKIIKDKCNGCCLSLLDQHGHQVLFFKLGQPTPCSETFSYQKAFTSYSFLQNNDEVYSSLISSGTQNLFNKTYCFISGGLAFTNKENQNYFLGISTDIPELDKKIALEISELIKG